MRTSRQGLRFDGLIDYVEIDNSEQLSTFTDGISIEIRFRPTDFQTGVDKRLVDKTVNTVGSNGYSLSLGTSTPTVRFRSRGYYFAGTKVLKKDIWHHVVGTLTDGGIISIYVDGELDVSDTSYLLPLAENSVMRIGDYAQAGNSPDRKVRGNIGPVRIYNRALSASEVAANYAGNVTHSGLVGEWLLNEGTGNIAHDTSGNGNHGTIYGATWLQKRPSRVLGVRMKPRKNMIPPFTDSRWGINEFATVISDYELVLNSDAAYRFTTIDLKVVPYQKYYLDFISNGTCQVRVGASTILFGKGSFTPQMPEISIRLYNPGSVAGTYTFTNLQLEPGTEATEWEPYVLVPDLKPV